MCSWHFECVRLQYHGTDFEAFSVWLKQRADRPTDKWKRYTATSLWDAVEGKPGELAFRSEYAPSEEEPNVVGSSQKIILKVREIIANVESKLTG